MLFTRDIVNKSKYKLAKIYEFRYNFNK